LRGSDVALKLLDFGLKVSSVSDSLSGFGDEEWVLVSGSLEFVAQNLLLRFFGFELDEAHTLHGFGGLVNSAPATILIGVGVEGLVSLGHLWGVFGVVLWGDDGEGLVGHWGVLESDISGLLGFLLHELDSVAHLGEHVELHEVLGEGAVAGGVAGSAVVRVGEAGGGFVVVIRVGFGGGDVGAWALGGVSGPLSAVIGSITERSAVSLHVAIVGEVHERILTGLGVFGMVDSCDLLSMGRVVAEVDDEVLETVEAVSIL